VLKRNVTLSHARNHQYVLQICLREQYVITGNVKPKGDNRYDGLLSRKNMQHDSFLAGNTVNGNCVQEMAEEISET